jgi:group I intron endonuclease
MIGVYKITSPTGKVSIGSSVDINHRWVCYKTLNCKQQTHLYRSLKKHGVDKHIFEIITECDIDNLLEFECYYGNLYDVLGKNGLNCKLPNKDDRRGSVREESKIKMSISSKGIKHTEETKKKIKEATIGGKNPFYGRRHSEETKEKIRQTKKKNFTEETRQNLRNAQLGKVTWMKGKKHTLETIAKMSKTKKGKTAWNKGLKRHEYPNYNKQKTA